MSEVIDNRTILKDTREDSLSEPGVILADKLIEEVKLRGSIESCSIIPPMKKMATFEAWKRTFELALKINKIEQFLKKNEEEFKLEKAEIFKIIVRNSFKPVTAAVILENPKQGYGDILSSREYYCSGFGEIDAFGLFNITADSDFDEVNARVTEYSRLRNHDKEGRGLAYILIKHNGWDACGNIYATILGLSEKPLEFRIYDVIQALKEA